LSQARAAFSRRKHPYGAMVVIASPLKYFSVLRLPKNQEKVVSGNHSVG
jgi:hypothetical protein